MEWIFVGAIACGGLVWYLYRRSQEEASEEVEPQPDETEDLLVTGLLLGEIYNDDQDVSDDTDADGFDDGFGGGYDDGGGLE